MIVFNIKSLRYQYNISQRYLSDITGIRLPTLSEYENSCATMIRVEHLNKLCEVFHCNLSDIITYYPDGTYPFPPYRP